MRWPLRPVLNSEQRGAETPEMALREWEPVEAAEYLVRETRDRYRCGRRYGGAVQEVLGELGYRRISRLTRTVWRQGDPEIGWVTVHLDPGRFHPVGEETVQVLADVWLPADVEPHGGRVQRPRVWAPHHWYPLPPDELGNLTLGLPVMTTGVSDEVVRAGLRDAARAAARWGGRVRAEG